MAKMVVYSCDRCKQAYTPYTSNKGYSGFQFFTHNTRKDDNGKNIVYGRRQYLCPECQEALESWAFEEQDQAEE